MKPNLAPFNSLPPKSSHLKAVVGALTIKEGANVKYLVDRTRLTRTQVLCALEALIQTGQVVQSGTPSTFSLRPT